MNVIHHKRSDFFLIKADNSYFLDVLCSRSFVSYSIAIQLNDAEITQFQALGIPYIETLAVAVNREQNAYAKRQVDAAASVQMHASIMAWNAANPRVQPPPKPKPTPKPVTPSSKLVPPAPKTARRAQKTPGHQLFLTTIKETITPLLKQNHFRKKGYYYTRQFLDTFQTIHLQSSTRSSHNQKRFYINVGLSFNIDTVSNPLRRPPGFQYEFAGSLSCGIGTRIRSFVSAAPDQWEFALGEDGDDKPTRQHLSDCLAQLVIQLSSIENAYDYVKHPMFTKSLAYPGYRPVNAQLYYMNDDNDLAWDMILQHTRALAQNKRGNSELDQPLHWTQRLGLLDLNQRAAAFSESP